MLAQVLAAAGDDGRHRGSFNNEIGVPLTVLRADADDPLPRRRDGRARASATSPSSARSCRPGVGVVLNVGIAHLGEFGSREAIAPGQGRARRGAARRRDRRAQRRRRAGRGDGGADVGAGADVRHGAGADVRLGDVAPRRRRAARPSSSATTGGRRAVALPLVGEHQAVNAAARPRPLAPAGSAFDLDVRRGALRRRRRCRTWRMEVATSAPTGSSSSTTPTTPTPTACARRSRRSSAIGGRAGGAGRSPCSARCASSGDAAARSTRRSGGCVAGLGIDRLVVGRGRGAADRIDGARAERARGRRAGRVAGRRERRLGWLRRELRAGRRRPGEGVAGRRSRGAGGAGAGRTRRRRRGRTVAMKAILLAGGLALIFTLLGTRSAIRSSTKLGYGQLIRDDGPTSHHTKRGTPDHGRRWSSSLGGRLAYFLAKLITARRAVARRRCCCCSCSSGWARSASSTTTSRSPSSAAWACAARRRWSARPSIAWSSAGWRCHVPRRAAARRPASPAHLVHPRLRRLDAADRRRRAAECW